MRRHNRQDDLQRLDTDLANQLEAFEHRAAALEDQLDVHHAFEAFVLIAQHLQEHLEIINNFVADTFHDDYWPNEIDSAGHAMESVELRAKLIRDLGQERRHIADLFTSVAARDHAESLPTMRVRLAAARRDAERPT